MNGFQAQEMPELEEELGKDEVVADSEEEDDSADSTRPFSRVTINVDGCSGIAAFTGGGERMDESRPNGVNYVGNEEPRECPQVDAFEVIEHLVALDDLDFLGRTGSAKVVKENSPCVLTVKGVHTLARRIVLTRLASDMGRFEWVDVDRSKDLEDGNGGSVRKRSKIKCMDAISEAGASGSESRYEAENKYQDGRSVKACTGGSEIEFIRDLDRNLYVEASGLLLNAHLVNGVTEDDCDVGVATQMAAEAMEALSHAPSGSSCSSFSPGLKTNLIPQLQSCFSSLDGSSSMKTRSCSESARLNLHSKEADDLLKNRISFEKDSSRRSATIFRQSTGKRTAGISGRTKQKDAALGSLTSSEYTMQRRKEKEANRNNKGSASVKGWSRLKAKPGWIKPRFPGENVAVDVDVVGKVGRSKENVGETDIFDNGQRSKHQELSPSSESRCCHKRKLTRINSWRFNSGAVDPQLSESRTLFKNKLNGSWSNREDYPSQNSLGTLTICLYNDGGILAPEKAKRSYPTGACSVNNLLPR